ncbi:MAG: hypothetical protein AB8G77_08625 [Rhodothermales bacterium]
MEKILNGSIWVIAHQNIWGHFSHSPVCRERRPYRITAWWARIWGLFGPGGRDAFTAKLGLLVDGDALAAPQGRAEDVLVALTFSATDQLDIKLGYRILEGGADNDEVYNFTLVNYASVGLILQL